MRYRKGNLITLAKEGFFDVITHGCNCFCKMGAGIAPQMAEAFGCDEFALEAHEHRGEINKLGLIDFEYIHRYNLTVINSYTQYYYGKNNPGGVDKPVDYDAIRLCMKKINHTFRGKTIGLPKIGAGLAGGDWEIIEKIINEELNAMDVWIVEYDGS